MLHDPNKTNSGGEPDRWRDNDFSPVRITLAGTPALVLIGISLIILTVGVVLASLLFVYLCFVYPSSANIIIPLILLPLGVSVTGISKKVQDAITDYRGKVASFGFVDKSEPSSRKLEAGQEAAPDTI